MVRFTLARVGQASAAVSVELVYKDVIYGWFGGMDRAYGSFLPNELLTWHILKWGTEKGFRLYDFGGAGKPDEEYGVSNFKAKFGGNWFPSAVTYASILNCLLLCLSKVEVWIWRRFISSRGNPKKSPNRAKTYNSESIIRDL
jgi:lipid II:glycine glycyltransferase (peptidoglycan interpeptide bridge formation enzyme)